MKVGIFSDVHSNIEALRAVRKRYDAMDFAIDKGYPARGEA